MGLVIRKPKGAAREYSAHSVSIYRKCSNGCQYCYLNRGFSCVTLGSGTPVLRSCFKNEEDAIAKFKRELLKNREQLIKDGGIFFCFTTDPCLKETFHSTDVCAQFALNEGVPVTILTKKVEWVYNMDVRKNLLKLGAETGLLCVGFTLTGRDDKEPFADSNHERCLAMRELHDFLGIKTFASIEPIVQFNKSFGMMVETQQYCDLFKIGLMSGVKKDYYNDDDLSKFIANLATLFDEYGTKMYIKESIRKRFDNPIINAISVSSDYNIFVEK